jgi:hypothetical protein
VTTVLLALLPRRYPLCGNQTVIGHGQRRKQAHDQIHDDCLRQVFDLVDRPSPSGKISPNDTITRNEAQSIGRYKPTNLPELP